MRVVVVVVVGVVSVVTLVKNVLTKNNKIMKTFRVVYLPHGREDKEWIDVQGTDKNEVMRNFTYGILIEIREKDDE
ncbi:hypothetical protein [Mycoplasmopsis arginini]|uniref:Uncharacterized protein n=1 Tax=Mycoplasmopsis arginini TaxID=2094 RepID=A0AA43U031_MYCAR|nr:hypothetical protein [Mycoplasmopsis arginini]MDI3349641.1 hypothetical protein [Mycoplasmopsis arginini]